MHRESALHADTEGHLADGEGLADATALTADHDTLEDLDPLLGTFDDLDVNVEGIAGCEFGDVVTK